MAMYFTFIYKVVILAASFRILSFLQFVSSVEAIFVVFEFVRDMHDANPQPTHLICKTDFPTNIENRKIYAYYSQWSSLAYDRVSFVKWRMWLIILYEKCTCGDNIEFVECRV